MAVQARTRDIVASRRRRADEGEEDEVGSLDYESQSELSGPSVANESVDDVASEVSVSVQQPAARTHNTSGSPVKQRGDRSKAMAPTAPATTATLQNSMATPVFSNTADMDALANGIKPQSEANGFETVQYEDADLVPFTNDSSHTHGGQAGRNPQRMQAKGPRPTPRIAPTTGPDPQRTSRRRGRESSSFGHATSTLQQGPSTTNERWSHDLHDLLENDMSNKTGLPIVEDIPRRNLPQYCPSAKGPEPLSRTVTIGHVTLRVALPGMPQPIRYEKTPLKYHIRLPDLRPPLRRDKPVRVSIAEQTPRYIFPSVDRSFIFIPRAQRPNQQGARRPFGSRRTSVFGGSSYSPSVAMSRRSSMARDGLRSPAAGPLSKAPFGAPTGPSRPTVKLPAGARPHMHMSNGFAYPAPVLAGPIDGVSEPMYPLPGIPQSQSQWNGQIPVHQPRPQKTVSVANIESPSKEKLHAPKQQEHQPFHHQVPNQLHNVQNAPEQVANNFQYGPQSYDPQQPPTAAPPHNIPEAAVNAQPFQPEQQPMYYPNAYPMQEMMYYQQPDNGANAYMQQPMLAPPVYMHPGPQGSYLVPMLNPATMPTMAPAPEAPQAMNSYEQNGTVYFYDASQYGGGGNTNGAAYTAQATDSNNRPNGSGIYYAPTPMNYYQPQQ